MSNKLKEIDYKGIFAYFEEISSVPRGSKNNKAISDYLVNFAKEHNLFFVQDEFLNVVIVKEATKGYENCPSVVIQGHMDMVCEKNSDTKHDFTTEAIDLRIDGDFIYANGTTLGGDDGIAIAYALAILSANDLKHPRLEVIFTTDEEIGMDGAVGLDTTNLHGKYMFNIDSEEEGIFLSSAAGGLTASIGIPLAYEMSTGNKVEVTIKGLQGGHSGSEIDKNRTNATVLMGRVLMDLKKVISYQVVDLKGGSKDNAIPRESFMTLVVRENDDTVKTALESLQELIKNELATSEPNFILEYKISESAKEQVLTNETFDKVLFMLLYAPNGIQTMSSDIKGLVESSLNLGIFRLEADKAIFGYAVRSSVDSYKSYMSNKLEHMAEHLGGTYSTSGVYPAWEYKKDSKLREIAIHVFESMYHKKPEIQAIHAGLECGIIADKMKGIDIISLGPDMYDVHTPFERLSISSSIRVYDFMIKILEAFVEYEM